jgi:hypothetical protein
MRVRTRPRDKETPRCKINTRGKCHEERLSVIELSSVAVVVVVVVASGGQRGTGKSQEDTRGEMTESVAGPRDALAP